MHPDAVPVVLGHFTLLAPRLDGFEPYGGVFFRIAIVTRGIRPGDVDRLEVVGLRFKCVEHDSEDNGMRVVSLRR